MLCVALTACAISKGAPERPAFMKAEAEVLRKEYGEIAINRVRTLPTDEAKQRYRNEMIEARTVLIDRRFYVWARNLLREEAGKNLAVDAAVIALNTTGTLTGGSLVKSILSAVSAGIVGIKGSFDKNAYYEKTIVALMLKMEAEREKIKLVMAQRGTLPISQYSVTSAIADLERLYAAGTLRGALVSITEEAGKDASNAKAERNAFTFRRDQAFIESFDLRKSLVAGVDKLTDEQAISLDRSIPFASAAIRQAVEARDRTGRRHNEGATARAILKMRITLSPAVFLKRWQEGMARVR